METDKQYNLSLFNSKIKWGVQFTVPKSLVANHGDEGLLIFKGFVGKIDESEMYNGFIVDLHLVKVNEGSVKKALMTDENQYVYKLSVNDAKALVTDIEKEGKELFEDMIEDIHFLPFESKKERMEWVFNEVYDKTRA